MKTQTIENNKLIDMFMGFYQPELIEENDIFSFEVWHSLEECKKDCTGAINHYNFDEIENPSFYDEVDYNTWDGIMPVVEKIEATEFDKIGYVDFHIMPDAIIVRKQYDEENPLILINFSDGIGSIEKEATFYTSKIEAVYKAVIEFIKWYNNENK